MNALFFAAPDAKKLIIRSAAVESKYCIAIREKTQESSEMEPFSHTVGQKALSEHGDVFCEAS